MDVAVSGSTGTIGGHLCDRLRASGHRVVRLVRSGRAGRDEVRWDPASGTIDRAGLEGVDAVVHLAGEPLTPPWTAAKRRRILRSREEGTRLLADALASLTDPPRVLVSQSAIGYYPADAGDEPLAEESAAGSGFMADVVRRWEMAADPARDAGIRVVHPRTGLVLAPDADFLRLQAIPARFGLGAQLGDGRHWQSWVHIDDEVAALLHLIGDERATGPVNVTAPNPVRNAEFADTLARVLERPRFLAVPRPVIRAVLGRDATDDFAFADQRVRPRRLQEELGFTFRFTQLEPALRAVLHHPR